MSDPPRRVTPSARKARRRVRRFLGASDWLLAAFALLFLGAYAWPILDPHLARGWKHLCDVVQWITWGVFAADYAARLWSARDRRQYFVRHLLDLLIVALPVLRPLRLMRLVVLFRVLNRKAASSLQGRVPLYVTVSASTLVVCAALAVLDAERSAPGAKITTFGNALWWAVVTVTTVGYGDYYPVTVTGRCIAVGLMIGGVALIGVVTASFAAWFIDRVRVVDEAEEKAVQAATQHDLQEIAHRIDVLTVELVELRKAANRAEAASRRAEARRQELSQS